MKNATTDEPTTNDSTTGTAKTTIGISLPWELVQKIRALARLHDRNFSSMCSLLLKRGMETLKPGEKNV